MMFLKSLIATAFALAAFVSADEEADKWAPRGGCGCHKPSSSSSSSHHHHHRHHHRHCSSSSSSSSSCPPPVCSPANSRRFVKQLQAEFDAMVQACDYVGAKSLARASASTSIIEPGCTSQTCCYVNQDIAGFLSRYTCGDQLSVLQPNPDNIRMFANGTVVISQIVVNVPVADPTVMNAYQYNYHWSPVYGCNFQLTYIDGFSLGCPNFVYNMDMCMLCK